MSQIVVSDNWVTTAGAAVRAAGVAALPKAGSANSVAAMIAWLC